MKHSVFLQRLQTVLVKIPDKSFIDLITHTANLFYKYPLHGFRVAYTHDNGVVFETYRYNAYRSIELFPDYDIVYLYKLDSQDSVAYDIKPEELKTRIREMMSCDLFYLK